MVHLSLFIYLFIYSFWQFPDSLWDCILFVYPNQLFNPYVLSDLVPVVLFPSLLYGVYDDLKIQQTESNA